MGQPGTGDGARGTWCVVLCVGRKESVGADLTAIENTPIQDWSDL